MFQQIQLIGNLGNKPEQSTTQSGVSVAKFSLATSKHVKGETRTTWHRIKVYNKTAENCAQYLDKGSKVLIIGEVNNYEYEKDGQKMYGSEIIGNLVKFLDSKGDSQQAPQGQPQQGYDNSFDDDIPF